MKKALFFEIPKSNKPAYLAFADGLRGAIQSGQLKVGEWLPSSRDLASRVGLHRHTIMSGLDELVAEGWVTSIEKKGYRVCETLPTRFFESMDWKSKMVERKAYQWRLAHRPFLAPVFRPDQNVKFNFKSGIPDLREFPFQEYKGHLNDSIRRAGPRVLGYGNPLGYEPLIEELKVYLRRVRALSTSHVIVTHGSQEAIYITAQLLLKKGDCVGVEELGYQSARATFAAAGATLVPLQLDCDGLVPSAFEKAAKICKLKLLYLTPLHQYPTTVTLPIARRLQIYEIAVKYGIAILEDDYDHEFHYRSQPLAPMASHDPAGIIIYVSTMSKVFSPSARVGFMSVPEPLVQPVSDYRRIVTGQNDILVQDALSRWMRSGGFERHLRRMRRIYEERRNTLVESLAMAKAGGTKISWHVPDGGMALWVDIQRDSKKFAAQAAEVGIYVGCEADYQSGSRARKGTGLRLGFANQNPREISLGIERLVSFL